MAKVVAYGIEKAGHFTPFVPVLQRLKSRGFAVELIAYSSDRRYDLGGVNVRRVHLDRIEAGRLNGLARRRWPWEFEQFAYYGKLVADVLTDALRRDRPDFVLVDPMLWGGMVAAEASGMPWGTLAHNPLMFRGQHRDFRGPGLRPPRTPFGRLGRGLLDATLTLDLDQRYLPLINSVRMAYGLRRLRHVGELFCEPPMILVGSAPPLEYPRTDWPPQLRFVGPLLWEPVGPKLPWIKRLPRDRPVVLLAGSTIGHADGVPNWAATTIHALADGPYHVLASLPTDERPRDLPANVQVESYLPHMQILSHVQCVVCHGGPGIVHKALTLGIPVVSVPFAYDRFEVARRVEVAGAGVMLSRFGLTEKRVRQAVDTAIARTSGARRIQSAFQQYGGAVAAADAIEEVLSRTTTSV